MQGLPAGLGGELRRDASCQAGGAARRLGPTGGHARWSVRTSSTLVQGGSAQSQSPARPQASHTTLCLAVSCAGADHGAPVSSEKGHGVATRPRHAGRSSGLTGCEFISRGDKPRARAPAPSLHRVIVTSPLGAPRVRELQVTVTVRSSSSVLF